MIGDDKDWIIIVPLSVKPLYDLPAFEIWADWNYGQCESRLAKPICV
jgi:hypothetical protein